MHGAVFESNTEMEGPLVVHCIFIIYTYTWFLCYINLLDGYIANFYFAPPMLFVFGLPIIIPFGIAK